ncbi:hypothetical protein Q7P35_011616 [Cladosporium inversicolor]
MVMSATFTSSPCCGFHTALPDGIVIAVDGACRDNGHPCARAAYGVYFNMGSNYNSAGLLDEGPMTNQRAEITAALEACKICYEILTTPDLDQEIRQIVIKSDSVYLVNSMVEWVEKWRDNDYKPRRGTPVVNRDLLSRLDEWVARLERMGVDVRFWHVLRPQNKQADKLADAALDGVDDRQFTGDDFGLMVVVK